MMDLYFVLWGMSVLGVVFGLFGAVIWLFLGAVTYLASRRSLSLAPSIDGCPQSQPEVTRYAHSAKISALLIFSAQACALFMVALNWATGAVGPVADLLEYVSASLLITLPAMLAALAVLSIASIYDIRTHLRVAGRDSAIALALAFGLHAALTAWLMAGGPGVQML